MSNHSPYAVSWDLSHGPVRVASNGRHLVHADGTYFLYLADTAWELFHRLDRHDVHRYLANRRDKGFTVIQAVVLAELDGLRTPNAQGDLPFLDHDPTKPNHAFFEHVDWVIDQAEAMGMYIGLLPTWGSYLTNWTDDTSLFTVESAEWYGHWLGQRYAHKRNLLWILGGDRPPCGHGRPDRRPHWDAMARGIALGVGGREDYGTVLMTYHPFGQHNSAEWFHDRQWLSFDMYQSGHYGPDDPNHYRMAQATWQDALIKPVLNGEPCYEDMCINFNPHNGWFDDADVRQAAYWSVFAGSFGFVYGAHGVWQMYDAGRRAAIHARRYWYDSLDLAGAAQMRHLRTLLLSRDPISRHPDQGLLMHDYGEGPRHLRSCRGNGYALIYAPRVVPITVNLHRLGGNSVSASWFDPRNGDVRSIGTCPASGTKVFHPPGDDVRGNDWVLVLDVPG